MDEKVIKHMLGDYVDGYEDVKDWPIAFIQEYKQRRRFMGTEEAANSMTELAKRVKRLDKYRDDSDTWQGLLNNKHVIADPRFHNILEQLKAEESEKKAAPEAGASQNDQDEEPELFTTLSTKNASLRRRVSTRPWRDIKRSLLKK
jgi:hypothetical protein